MDTASPPPTESDPITQALLAERIAVLNTDFGRHEERLDQFEKRLRKIEIETHRRVIVHNHIERFVWIMVSAIVGLAAYFLRG